MQVHDGRSGQTLHKIPGGARHGFFGLAIAALGDLDGDGAGDLAVGGALGDVVRIHSGRSGAVLNRLTGTSPSGIELFGVSLAAVRDIDGDGAMDLLVGAPGRDTQAQGGASASDGCGGAYLFSGKSGALLRTLGEPVEKDQLKTRWFGRRVACAGDVDGDGVDDLAIASGDRVRLDLEGSEWRRMPGGKPPAPPDNLGAVLLARASGPSRGPDAGQVFLFSGKTGELIRHLSGERPGDGFGCALVSLGDLDGDGCAELAVGACAADGGGALYAFDGASGRKLHVARGERPACEFGYSLANVGDWNVDGCADLAVGDPCADRGGNRIGEVAILSGRDFSRLTTLNEGGPDLNVSDYGFAITPLGTSTGEPTSLVVGALNGGWYGMVFAYAGDGSPPRRRLHLDLGGLYGRLRD